MIDETNHGSPTTLRFPHDAVSSLRSSRSRHGHALRAARKVGADLVREAFGLAAPMLAVETVALPRGCLPGESHYRDLGRGVLVLDLSVHDRWQHGYDEGETQKGPQVWARADGSLFFARADHSAERWEPWSYLLLDAQYIGYREAVRRFGAEELVVALGNWLVAASASHDAATAEEQGRARRFTAALAAL
jgi:hypothetical protein